MKYLILLMMAGCSFSYENIADKTHNEALKRKCSEVQLKQVQNYFDVCIKSSYVSSYCFDLALINFCEVPK